MRQVSFSDIEYGMRKRTTKRDEFLKAMDEFIPYTLKFFTTGKDGRQRSGISLRPPLSEKCGCSL